ncbi:cation/acetate symporter [Thermosporothrix hazakensis]|jgi:cation/acetate symporter|uniref:Cation/acetate symporter n=1 Tax=Thermosporothrix hazakensis TaxID=644383 RepID=A0A326UQS7_THEHA|nr:cation acetate symporter [Thermosporothrix hazakensis]PZW32837.1 cation/acetate symporter [Thermosporothrix hazakensis]GCE48868.1 putative symporter YwcA [Thermosporothrix hazakensis]
MTKEMQTLLMFGVIVVITLVVTYWASRRMRTTTDFYAAGRRIGGLQNGLAVAGDYMSAASFLGIAGLIAFFGYDGFMYSVGFLVAYLTVLFLVAEPLRNTGKFTMADVLSFRLRQRSVRTVAALSTLAVTLIYMIAQMVGAGSLVNILVPTLDYNLAIIIVGVLMICYVVFGGMLATTWVQIIKAVLLMGGTFLLSLLVLSHYNFSISAFFDAINHVTGQYCTAGGVLKNGQCTVGVPVTKTFLQPGLKYHGTFGQLDLISLGLALVLGTAGLPHILMRFYTVPNARTARSSVVWATVLIGIFYILTTFLGFGAALLVGKEHIKNQNLAAPLLAESVGGPIFLAFIAAVAFATILAVVAGLTIAGSSAFAHDIWVNVIKGGKENEREQVLVAKVTAVVIGLVSIGLALLLRNSNVAFLVGLAFAVAASANVPAIVLTLFWRRFNTAGMIAGMLAGLISSILLIVVSPAIMGIDPPGTPASAAHLIQAPALFPLENPGLISIPLGFLVAIVVSLLTRDEAAREAFSETNVRANLGINAEE